MKRARIALVFVLAGCSMQASYRGPPHDRGAMREELDALKARIASQQKELQVERGPADRCQKMREVAGEICRCSERICLLADALAEAGADRACAESRGDCARATEQATAACQ